MSQARHKRTPEPSAAQTTVWKAEEYRQLRAVPGARWTRIDPFRSYRPQTQQRELRVGPHAVFLRLRKLFLEKKDLYPTAMDVFASDYGLLGLFHHLYSAPILPKHKVYIAPEAVIENGRLRMVDPATEGLELVAKAVNDGRPPTAPQFIKEYYVSVAMPGEVRFATKDWYRYPDDPSGRPLTGEDESWEEVRAPYDALFVLDPTRRTRSSVLVRKESTFAWQSLLEDFPAPPYTEERLPSLARIFDDRLADTSPKISVEKESKLSRSWRCNTLLQAMYLMLFEDLIGGARLRECDSHDCSNYYRLGPQTNTRYCSLKHTNRASTRISRGQEP